MRFGKAIIAILLVSMISKLAEGNSILEEENNFTTGSSTSPWLKKVMNHGPRPRPPGCRSTPWICREGLHPSSARMRCCRNQCVDVSSDVSNCGFCGIRCRFARQCCHGFCVDTNRSPFHCGRCGNRCPRKVRCVYGMCGYAQPFPPLPFP